MPWRPRRPRRAHLVLLIAATGALLTACDDGSSTTTDAASSSADPTTPPGTGSSSDGGDDRTTRTITVTAVGHAHGQPDSLTLLIGAEVTAPTVAEALAELSTKLTNLLGFLGDSGVPGEDIQTAWLSTYPMYDGGGGGVSRITGYQASVAVNVRVGDLDAAGSLVDGATFVLGDALRLHGISWTIVDSDPLLSTARADGVERARRQAEQIAQAAGLELGALRSIDEGGGTPGTTYADAGGDGEGLPLSPGSQAVTVTVRAVFEAMPAP